MQRLAGCLLILLAATLGWAQKPATTTTATKAAAPAEKAHETQLPSEDTVNAFLHQMFGYDSTLTYKISDIKPSEAEGIAEVTIVISSPQAQQVNKLYVSEDGKHALVGDIIPFGAKPFDPAVKILQASAHGPSRGPLDAPVTIVEFSDLQCPHCKEAQPKIDKLMSEEKNVRLVFENLPLPMHDWAAKAAAYADCIGNTSNEAFWKFIQGTYDAQSDITLANADDKLKAVADTAGAKSADVAACAAKPQATARVDASVALAQSLGVNSTPTLFINGRKVAGVTSMSDEIFKSLVDFAAQEAK